jgi:GT2 family glycosyltransferase
MTTLTIVTPWWNHLDLLPDYRDVIAAGIPDEIIIVDNGSEPIFECDAFKVIRNRTNRGFSRACNQGLHAATSDAVLFLNNDIRRIDPDPWADKIKAALKPGTLVGANLRNAVHSNVDGHIIPYLDGWCMGGMRDDLQALGGWDESYAEPSYYGDNDLCVRAIARGFQFIQIDLPFMHLLNATAKIFDVREVTTQNYLKYAEKVRSLMGGAK